MNENGKRTYHDLQHAMKAVFGGNYITVNTHIREKDHKSIA